MKRPLFSLFTILFAVLLAFFCYWGYHIYVFTKGIQVDRERHLEQTAIYFIDLPDGLDTMAFEANIILDTNKTFHKIHFPNGGTQTTVLVYDTTFAEQFGKQEKEIRPLIERTFSMEKEVIVQLPLTLPDFYPDKYYIHYLSCKMGGIFPLNIQENKQ